MFVCKHTETIEYLNTATFLKKKQQNSWVNDSRIMWIRNVKFLECFLK